MFTNRLFVLIVALALLTVGALTINSGVATPAVANVNVSHSDYVRDPSGYAAPYISRSDTVRDASHTISNDPYVSRSDFLRSSASIAPYVSRSDILRSGVNITPYVSHSDFLRSSGQ